jgi:hypothetical protein
MSAPIPRFEAGDTRQFSVTYSGPPSTPYLAIKVGSGDGTLVYSVTAAASTATEFYAFWTLPSTAALYTVTWVASYTAGPVVLRDYMQAIRTIPG